MRDPLAAHWAALAHQFEYHAKLLVRFRAASQTAVVRMWKSQANENGEPLSQFEREALVERYCALFGMWPE